MYDRWGDSSVTPTRREGVYGVNGARVQPPHEKRQWERAYTQSIVRIRFRQSEICSPLAPPFIYRESLSHSPYSLSQTFPFIYMCVFFLLIFSFVVHGFCVCVCVCFAQTWGLVERYKLRKAYLHKCTRYIVLDPRQRLLVEYTSNCCLRENYVVSRPIDFISTRETLSLLWGRK